MNFKVNQDLNMTIYLQNNIWLKYYTNMIQKTNCSVQIWMKKRKSEELCKSVISNSFFLSKSYLCSFRYLNIDFKRTYVKGRNCPLIKKTAEQRFKEQQGKLDRKVDWQMKNLKALDEEKDFKFDKIADFKTKSKINKEMMQKRNQMVKNERLNLLGQKIEVEKGDSQTNIFDKLKTPKNNN